MKYSNYIGAAAALALIIFCFVPWVYIESLHATITGVNTAHTTFGSPAIIHIFLSVFSIILFVLPKAWSKGINVFVVAFNFAWSIRNFLLFTQCQMGECPEKRAGIYAIILLSFIMMVMTLFPKIKVEDKTSK